MIIYEEKARGTSLVWEPTEAPLHGQLGKPNCLYCRYYTTVLLGMQILASLLSVPKMRSGVVFYADFVSKGLPFVGGPLFY
jgi:hypothetical protein